MILSALLSTLLSWGLPLPSASAESAIATFAGGCFWCMEQPFDQLTGVISTTAGYTGGQVENPSYSAVSSGRTGHVEAVQVRYEPAQIGYELLLEVFWHNVDPLDEQGQFCDRGSQYRSVVFTQDEQQRALAEASKQAVAEQLDSPVETKILPAVSFYAAEAYHQNYYQTHPVRYKLYRFACGRDQRLAALWGTAHAESPPS
ncbi:MAG: peptide-methionine (S)-S-oxide reductase MsrA [Leptolyngbya sp. SIO4C1]|nr:peptide-methionine (S)-S-oxide reductase MsrA [Leptolyngbya sp. SIO4C1]